MALAKKFIHQWGVPGVLIWGVFYERQPGTLVERMQLLDYIIEQANNTKTLRMIIGELVAHVDITPNAFDRILAVGKKISPEEFESWLVAEAYRHSKFAVALAEFLHHLSDFCPRFRVKEFLDLIENGYPPPEAARKCLNL